MHCNVQNINKLERDSKLVNNRSIQCYYWYPVSCTHIQCACIFYYDTHVKDRKCFCALVACFNVLMLHVFHYFQIHWLHNSVLIVTYDVVDYNLRGHMKLVRENSNDRSLLVTNFTNKDVGKYECVSKEQNIALYIIQAAPKGEMFNCILMFSMNGSYRCQFI